MLSRRFLASVMVLGVAGLFTAALPAQEPLTGACCANDGSCTITTEAECDAAGGTYRGDATTCEEANCPIKGGCCMPNGSCTISSQIGCTLLGGTYRGDNTDCVDVICPQPNRLSFAVLDASSSGDLTAILNSADPIQGWSFGVCSDPAFLAVDGFGAGNTTAGLNGGAGPSFMVIDGHFRGVSMAVVIDSNNPADVLPPGGPYELLDVSYSAGPEAELETRYPVTFCDTLGDPAVALAMVVGGQNKRPLLTRGNVEFPFLFLRGDSNDDGQVDLSDGIYGLDYLFRAGDEPDCLEAADANDSNAIDIADPVYTFNFLFTGGPAPPAPFPLCADGGRRAIGCDDSRCNTPLSAR